MNSKKGIIFAGAVIGIFSAILIQFGNPGNMGVCVACFLRDIAGSLGLHGASKLAYIRPEIIGIVLGAFIAAFYGKDFKSRGGSAPLTRFLLAMCVVIGALVFLGCPLRMVLRLAGGDLNAIVGMVGFAAGIGVGIYVLNKGFSLKRSYKQGTVNGYLFPAIMVGLLVLVLVKPAFIIIGSPDKMPAFAPLWLSLAAGLATGLLAQRTRLCMVGGIRDLIMFKDSYLILGFLSILVFATLGNVFFGNINIGFAGQPAAHSDGLLNFAGMFVAGWGSVLLGGCPLRQLILSGEGDVDSATTIFGLIFGAAIAHNFGLVSASPRAPYALGIIVIFLLVVSITNREKLA